MNIGEFFVNLGVKGSDKAIGSLESVKKSFGELGSTSIETKAAIVGAMYALEQTFANSGKAGTGLTNFNALLGVSTKTLQQYQYAARQMGVTNEDVEGSFRGIQAAMSKTLMGEGAPKGMARVAALTGGISPQDMVKYQQNPEELMKRLQEYANKEKNTGLRNEVLKTFGMSDTMIAAMTRNAFNPGALSKAPTYSDKEIGALDKANIAWSNLGQKIEMAVGHFNAKHGGQLVNDISKITDQVVKLVEAFSALAEKLKFFKGIGKIFEGWNLLLGGVTKTVDSVSDPKKRKELGSDLGQFVKEIPGVLTEVVKDIVAPEDFSPSAKNITPPIKPATAQTKNSQDVEINQTLNFQHDGKDHVKTADSVKKAVQSYYRQSAAQGQGS